MYSEFYIGDSLDILKRIKDNSIDCVVTSPAYFNQRDYLHSGQLGHDASLDKYLDYLKDTFIECYRIMKPTASFWLNIDDKYADTNYPAYSIKKGSLMLVPYRLSIKAQEASFIVRSDNIWRKNNNMPSSAKNRTTRNHEYVFMFTKTNKYYFNNNLVKEELGENSDVAYRAKLRANKQYNSKEPYKSNFPKSFDLTGKNRRSVWDINCKPYTGSHAASYPEKLAELCIKAGCPSDGIVLDIFSGAGTSNLVACKLGVNNIGIDINKDYIQESVDRLSKEGFKASSFTVDINFNPSNKIFK